MSIEFDKQNSPSLTTISLMGLMVFGYSAYELTFNAINFEWILLSLVTVLMVSRIDIGFRRARNAVAISDAFIFISVLLYGTYASAVLAGLDGVACAVQLKQRRRLVLFNGALMSLSIFASSSAVSFMLGESVPLAAGEPIRMVLAAGMLALLHLALVSGLRSLASPKEDDRSYVSTWKETLLWTSFSMLAGAACACIIVKLIYLISFYAFIISVPILTVTYFTYKVYLDRVETSNRHAEQMAELHLKTIEALAIAIDAKDEVTPEHVHRVQIYATGLARLFGLSEPELEALKAGALLHDIGKLAVPDYILNKPGPLTPAEFDKMKVHTIVGAEILERVGFPYPVVPVVRHHHERWDGRGYPDGLRGDEIPITARILTLSDCFDAVREDRNYREAMTRDQAIDMLKEGSGTVFDPNVVRTFLDHLDEFEAEIRERCVEPHRVGTQYHPGTTRMSNPDSEPVYERIRSAHREVITLYDIAQTIGTSLDLRDTFAVFASRMEDIVSYTTCVLYLVRPDSTDVEAAHIAGRNAELLKGKGIPSGAGITGWVVANGHPMHNCDPRLDFDVLKIETNDGYRTASVVPLMKDDAVLGALAMYSAELSAYTADHLRLMEAVAKLASDAIANAVQHEKTETSALTDLLTGLANARALRYRFEEEADRARRHRDRFSVMMMDLDGFKAVNDKFGHQAGDQLLRELSVLLSSHIRSSDFVSRYAGDEFVAIMQVGAEEVQELAQRIQREIDRHDFGFQGTKLFIGLSVGCASFGMDGETLDELLLAADRAMYVDKAKRKAQFAQSNSLTTNDLGQYRLM